MAKNQMKGKLMSIIVCETGGRWAAALRKELPPGMPLVETRSLGELWQWLPRCPDAVIMLELKAERIGPVVAGLLQIARQFPRVMPIVVADRKLSAWENACREAGAVHFVTSPRRLAEVADIVQRRMNNLQKFDADDSEEHQSIEERILATLPWGQ
jgi:hypothetical protein